MDADRVRDILRRVVDPEVGMNIVDLGLVYGVEVQPAGVTVTMTMTSPACPMGEIIVDEVRAELAAALPAGSAIQVALVWEPPWTPARMSARSKAHFGWQAGDPPEPGGDNA